MDPERSIELYRAGKAAVERGDFDAAVVLLRDSLAALPHFKTTELLGECLLDKGRLKEAVVYLAAAVGLGNRAFRALSLLVTALAQCGDKLGALEQAQKAWDIPPSYHAHATFSPSCGGSLVNQSRLSSRVLWTRQVRADLEESAALEH
jgi:tetratricopeptide (TPR) repeat protein